MLLREVKLALFLEARAGVALTQDLEGRPILGESSTVMYNKTVGQESAQKFMKQTGDLKDATLYFAS